MSSDLGRVAQRKSPIVISYSNPGTKPPIYLAGSFCDWQPQEMRHTIDGQGEYTFTKEVEVKGGKEYQYKFRVGEGDWWLLNEDQPIGMYARTYHTRFDLALSTISRLDPNCFSL